MPFLPVLTVTTTNFDYAQKFVTAWAGEFVEFRASYTHASELGGEETSVIVSLDVVIGLSAAWVVGTLLTRRLRDLADALLALASPALAEVRLKDDRGVLDRRGEAEHVLHVAREDLVAAPVDDVAGSPVDPHEAVLVDVGDVVLLLRVSVGLSAFSDPR